MRKTGICFLILCVVLGSMSIPAYASGPVLGDNKPAVSEEAAYGEENSEMGSEDASGEEKSEKSSEDASEEDNSEMSSEDASGEEKSEMSSEDASGEEKSEMSSEDASEEDNSEMSSEDASKEENSERSSEDASEEINPSDALDEEGDLGDAVRISNLKWNKAGYVTYTPGTEFLSESIRVYYEGRVVYETMGELSKTNRWNVQYGFNESGKYTIRVYQFSTYIYHYERTDISDEIEVTYNRPATELKTPTNLHWESASYGQNYICYNGSEHAQGYIIKGYEGRTSSWSIICTRPETKVEHYRDNTGYKNYFSVQAISSDISKWANSKEGYWDVFKDVSASAWYRDAVYYVVYRDIMTGTGKGTTFSPNSDITRAQVVTVLYGCAGKPAVSGSNPFKDVKNNQYYTNAVLWANEKGIAKGHKAEDGSWEFGVDNYITRQDLAVMLRAYANSRGYYAQEFPSWIMGYQDYEKVSPYARGSLGWAAHCGIISGKGTAGGDVRNIRLDPAGHATRAEFAAMIRRFYEYYS